MPLQLFGFRDRPHDFAATKAALPLDECAFLLDFTRPLERVRWLGVVNGWIGPVVALNVPVVHESEETGTYLIHVRRGEPYFADLPALWQKHAGTRRTIKAEPIGGIALVADFARHFPADSHAP